MYLEIPPVPRKDSRLHRLCNFDGHASCDRRAMLETLLREMDEEGVGDDSGETVVHDNDQVRCVSMDLGVSG